MNANTDSPGPDAQTLQTLVDELERLHERVTTLEDELTQKDDRIGHLEAELEEAHTENKDLAARLENLEQSRIPIEARLDAHEKKLNANKDRVGELQARELEKGAHLLEDHVDEGEIDVVDGRLERIQKDDGESYFRLPESGDPLERGGDVSLSYGDLLPLQQLAKMDEDMLRATTSALPSRLAAKLWKARTDPAVGDNPWRKGSASVREYVTAGDMKHWIRRQEKGISDDYAKKLVSRTIDALLDLSKSRLAVKKRTQRKNGLEYTERRVLLMDDVDIPGEMASSGDT
jgi:regulator of replication initiation timing